MDTRSANLMTEIGMEPNRSRRPKTPLINHKIKQYSLIFKSLIPIKYRQLWLKIDFLLVFSCQLFKDKQTFFTKTRYSIFCGLLIFYSILLDNFSVISVKYGSRFPVIFTPKEPFLESSFNFF